MTTMLLAPPLVPCQLSVACKLPDRHHGVCPHLGRYDYRRTPLESFTKILPGLFMGGGMQQPTGADFDAVITLNSGAIPIKSDIIQHIVWHIRDAELPDLSELGEVAESAHMLWLLGKRVLVRCQMGLNRSALVVGHILTDVMGWSATDAIQEIRIKRSPYALFNENFESYLRRF